MVESASRDWRICGDKVRGGVCPWRNFATTWEDWKSNLSPEYAKTSENGWTLHTDVLLPQCLPEIPLACCKDGITQGDFEYPVSRFSTGKPKVLQIPKEAIPR